MPKQSRQSDLDGLHDAGWQIETAGPPIGQYDQGGARLRVASQPSLGPFYAAIMPVPDDPAGCTVPRHDDTQAVIISFVESAE